MLRYITRTHIPSRAAQSQQISAMAYAFNDQLAPSAFQLISSVGSPELPPYHRPLPFSPTSDKARYLAACISAAWITLRHRQHAVVYTRDIFVALTTCLFGGRAAYEAHKEPKGSTARLCTQWLATRSNTRFVLISQALSSYYRHHFQLPDNRTLVAHDGAFPENYQALRTQSKQQLRQELGLPLDKTLIVHTGSLYEGRGAHLFEQVARHSPDVMLIQVGGEDRDIERWNAHYKALGLQNIIFHPRQDSDTVRRFQVCADVLFYMITKETATYWCCSPLKLFEYMASGTPILGASIGSIGEVLNEHNAYIFDPENHETIGTSLNEILKNPISAASRAQRAVEAIRNEYAWSIRAQRILDFVRT